MLLIICNNASPAFIISFVTYSCLSLDNKYIIWVCTIGSSFITYYTIKIFSKITHNNTSECNINNNYIKDSSVSAAKYKPFLTILEQTIMRSFEILLLVGGYIITASLIINVISNIIPNTIISVVTSGILEITTGIKLITNTPELSIQIKSAAAAALCGFGGISGILQTNSVIRASGMSILKYTIHKLICGIISGLLCIIYLMIIN